MCVCMHGYHLELSQSVDQPGKFVANPARGQLNKKTCLFFLCPASACSFSSPISQADANPRKGR